MADEVEPVKPESMSMSDRPGGVSEAWRYARAAVAGVAIAFVMLVAAPQLPLSYPLAIGLYVVAGVLFLVND
jgi:hypothetical protein